MAAAAAAAATARCHRGRRRRPLPPPPPPPPAAAAAVAARHAVSYWMCPFLTGARTRFNPPERRTFEPRREHGAAASLLSLKMMHCRHCSGASTSNKYVFYTWISCLALQLDGSFPRNPPAAGKNTAKITPRSRVDDETHTRDQSTCGAPNYTPRTAHPHFMCPAHITPHTPSHSSQSVH